MFLEKSELKTVIYAYQLQEITEMDDDIVLMAISAALDEVKSYLRRNNRKDWADGRLVYDVDATFSKTGTERHALLLEQTKNIALFNVIRLCNVDILYEKAKELYDRTIAFLQKVNKGDITLDLPLLTIDDTTEPAQPFIMGSRLKFNHE